MCKNLDGLTWPPRQVWRNVKGQAVHQGSEGSSLGLKLCVMSCANPYQEPEGSAPQRWRVITGCWKVSAESQEITYEVEAKTGSSKRNRSDLSSLFCFYCIRAIIFSKVSLLYPELCWANLVYSSWHHQPLHYFTSKYWNIFANPGFRFLKRSEWPNLGKVSKLLCPILVY